MSEFNEGHIVEGLDRLNIVAGLIEDLLINQNAVLKAGSNCKILEAQKLILEAYQEVGNLTLD